MCAYDSQMYRAESKEGLSRAPFLNGLKHKLKGQLKGM